MANKSKANPIRENRRILFLDFADQLNNGYESFQRVTMVGFITAAGGLEAIQSGGFQAIQIDTDTWLARGVR